MNNSSASHADVENLRKEIEYLRKRLIEAEAKAKQPLDACSPISVLEDLPDLLCLFGSDGMITYANTAFCKYFKKSKNEAIGSTVFSYILRKDRERFAHQIETLSPQKPIRKFEYRVMPSNDEVHWHQWTLKGLFNTSDMPADYILAGRDITNLKNIEEDLIDTLEKYATLFESTKDAIILLDLECFIDCNDAALKTFRSVSKESFLRCNFHEFSFSPPDGRPESGKKLVDHLRRALKYGMERFQWMCRRTDGTVFPADIILSPFPLGTKKILAAVIRDISDLKKTEEALRKSREEYRELVENINDAIFSLDDRGIITYTSPVIRKITGYKPQEMIGRHFTDFVHPEDLELIRGLYAELLSGKIMSFEYRILKKTGALCWLRAFNKPIADGDKLRIYGVVTDITTQKKAEEALKKTYDELEEKVKERTAELRNMNKRLSQEILERKRIEQDLRLSEERYHRIAEELEVVLNGITDHIMMLDTESRIIWANKAASLSLDLSREELIGRLCHELWHNRSEPCENCPAQQAVRTGKSHEETIKTKAGSLWDIMGYPVKDEHGNVRGAIEISRDVTDRKILEEELQKRYKLDSLGTLAGGIAHDFNNILTVILGNVSLAKMLIDPKDKILSRLEDIEKASAKARDLTNQLLTFSKGGSPLKKRIALDQLLRDTVHFALQNSDITARFHTSGNLWQVEADEAQIARVIDNIILNAQQAMPGGGTITVEAGNCTGEENSLIILEGNHVKVSINDTGCGIEGDILSNIFDPFFTTKRKSHGLGLATAYSIVRRHGGHITASSTPGTGTTISFYLPAVPETEARQSADTQEMVMGRGRILFMDDESFIRDLARSALKHLGYEAVFARDGHEAIHEYRKALDSSDPFDAVILDLTVVEGMGGKECIKELKKIEPSVKAIVSSGYSHDPIMAEPEKYGFSAFIAKPYNIQTLSNVLVKTINGSVRQSEST